MKVAEVEDMEIRLSTDISLEHPHYPKGKKQPGHDQRDDNIEDVVADKEKKEILERKITEFKKMLTDKEFFIFEHRIMIEEPLTLQQIGEQFRISRERVRQLENRVHQEVQRTFEQEFRELELY